MGVCKYNSEIKSKFVEIKREIINQKFKIYFQLIEKDEIAFKNNYDIIMEVIHVETVGSTMPSSREYIDEGNKLPFIYNAVIQTAGKGKGQRKWAGSIPGNIYTSSCIPLSMIKNELNNNDIIVKITAISIIQQLTMFVQNEFFLKYPNDIICKDKRKLGGIISENYKDFCIIGFGINIVDKPEQDQIRKEGLSPCYVNAHIPYGHDKPNALELSIEITKQIIYNLKFTKSEIDQLFKEYIKSDL